MHQYKRQGITPLEDQTKALLPLIEIPNNQHPTEKELAPNSQLSHRGRYLLTPSLYRTQNTRFLRSQQIYTIP